MGDITAWLRQKAEEMGESYDDWKADAEAANAREKALAAHSREVWGVAPRLGAHQLAGRCLNGAERDSGKLWHAVQVSNGLGTALCGARPGRTSAGWSEGRGLEAVTCKRCKKKLGAAP